MIYKEQHSIRESGLKEDTLEYLMLDVTTFSDGLKGRKSPKTWK